MAEDVGRPVVGFIGIGTMGKPMAKRILKAGHHLVVWNRTIASAEELREFGAEVVSSPREVAERSSIVITILAGPQSVLDVVFGKGTVLGLAAALEAGKTLIDMTTNLPSLSRRIAREVRSRGAEFLDAPVCGSVKPAVEGTLLILVGGKKETLEHVRPVLQTMGDKIVHVGDSGDAASMKLVLQMQNATMMVSFAESMAFGARSGLEPSLMLDIINNSIFKTCVSENKGKKVIESDYGKQHALDSMTKDLDLVAESASEMQIPLPVIAHVRKIFHAAKEAGKSQFDYSAVASQVENMMKTKISQNVRELPRAEQD